MRVFVADAIDGHHVHVLANRWWADRTPAAYHTEFLHRFLQLSFPATKKLAGRPAKFPKKFLWDLY